MLNKKKNIMSFEFTIRQLRTEKKMCNRPIHSYEKGSEVEELEYFVVFKYNDGSALQITQLEFDTFFHEYSEREPDDQESYHIKEVTRLFWRAYLGPGRCNRKNKQNKCSNIVYKWPKHDGGHSRVSITNESITNPSKLMEVKFVVFGEFYKDTHSTEASEKEKNPMVESVLSQRNNLIISGNEFHCSYMLNPQHKYDLTMDIGGIVPKESVITLDEIDPAGEVENNSDYTLLILSKEVIFRLEDHDYLIMDYRRLVEMCWNQSR